VLSLVLVVAIFYYLLTKIDLAQTWAAITDMAWTELATLGLLAIWNLCTYALVWMAVTPGLGFWRAMVMTQATTAVANTVPGGSAIGIGMTYSMLGSWGYSRSRTTTAVLVSGVWNSFIKLGMPVLALALVLLQGGAGGGRVLAAVVGIAGLVTAIVVFALMLRSEDQARRFGLLAGRVATRLRRIIGRGPVSGWEVATVKFRNRTIDLVAHRWISITVWSLVSHLSLYAVLLVALRDVGVSDAEVGWAEVLAVFAFARLVTAIPITPGGAGLVEAALIGGLIGAGATSRRWPRPCSSTGRSPGPCRSWSASPAMCGGDARHGPPRPKAPSPRPAHHSSGTHDHRSGRRRVGLAAAAVVGDVQQQVQRGRDGQADRGPADHVQRVVHPQIHRATALNAARAKATIAQRRGSTNASSLAIAKVIIVWSETTLSPPGCTPARSHLEPWSPNAPAAPAA
jgi:uncharacterized protein (TIRG00374 family)